MRVFGRALVLGVLVAVCVPAGAVAAPILVSGPGDDLGCAGLVTRTDSCSRFTVDALSSDPLQVQFSLLEDVALLEFELLTDTLLSVATNPIWPDAAGPFFGVFNPLTLDTEGNRAPGALDVVTFAHPDGSGALVKVLFDVLDPLDPTSPDNIPVILAPGAYLLALIGPSNFFNSDPLNNLESLAFGFSQDFLTTPCAAGEPGCAFSVAFNATPVDGGPDPIPEPGTLTLMAGGAIAGLIHRRRSKKRTRSESVSR